MILQSWFNMDLGNKSLPTIEVNDEFSWRLSLDICFQTIVITGEYIFVVFLFRAASGLVWQYVIYTHCNCIISNVTKL